MRASFLLSAAAIAALLLPACSHPGMVDPLVNDAEVRFEPTGFPALAQSGGVFELWISFALTRHSIAASAGRFLIDASGKVVGTDGKPMTFAVDPASDAVPTGTDGKVYWQLAEDAFVTLETPGDPGADPEPTLPAIIAGSFLNGHASLDKAGNDALGLDFSSIGGTFHLATPTTTATTDEKQGVWFAAVGGQAASLTLPTLSSGWVYEAWLAPETTSPVSLGRFSSPSGMDSNGWGPAGDADGYAFPGQDFPLGAGTDITSGSVFITLEPESDADGSGPFTFLKLLSGPVPAQPATAQALTSVASFPTASVTIPYNP